MKLLKLTLIFIVALFFSNNMFAQWESIGSGISEIQSDFFSMSVVDEDNVWAVPLRVNSTAIYKYARTTDGGITWEEGSLPNTNGNYYPINIFTLDENTAWIIMINLPSQQHIKIFKTEDAGTTWEEQDGGFNEVGHAFAALHFFNEDEGVGFGSPGTGAQTIDSLQIFKTNDEGDNWNRIPPSELPTPLSAEGVWVFSGNSSYEVKGDTIWFVTRASRVFRSTDRGNSWNAYKVDISGARSSPGLTSIAFESSLNGIAVSFNPGKASRTTDGGETWSKITIPPSYSLGAIEYIPGTENTYFTNDGLGNSNKMLLTKDGGDTWEEVNYSPSMDCMQFISPSVGFGGGTINFASERGLYKWTGDLSDSNTTNIVEYHSHSYSDEIALFPNPTQDQLTISFKESIFESNVITIEMFSIDGRIVRQNEYQNSNEINISVENLPKGLYNIRIGDTQNYILDRFIKE